MNQENSALLAQAIELFWETIPPLWSGIRAHIRSVAAENFDITVEQFHVLRLIRKGKRTMGELAAARNISRPAVSQAVDMLVNKGLVTRTDLAADRRCVRLELTPDGGTLLEAVFQNTREWMSTKLVALNPQELRVVMQAMEALQKTLPEIAP